MLKRKMQKSREDLEAKRSRKEKVEDSLEDPSRLDERNAEQQDNAAG